jgi:hypothetical protein
MSICKYPIISSTWLSVPCKYTLSPVPYQYTFITLSVPCQYSVSTLQLLCQCPFSNLVSTVPLPRLCRYSASIKYSAIASTSQYTASILEISCQLSISSLAVLCQYPATNLPVPCQYPASTVSVACHVCTHTHSETGRPARLHAQVAERLGQIQ